MPLPLPNLDDRRYADLVEEARALMVTYAPSLTNHNPSDPLVTLTELFAYLTEILLFRLNLVTDANRIVFLRLLNGPEPPPKPGSEPKPPLSGAALDAAIRAAVLKVRTIDRAVTPADFEFLALSADDKKRVVRARCISEQNLSINNVEERYERAPGHISVVILLRGKPEELPDVQRLVEDHLDLRRLLTTRVHVVEPRFVPVGIHVTLNLLPDVPEEDARARVLDALRQHFDPLVGGEGDGWPFGRTVHLSEIYRLLDGVAGVDFVSPPPAGDPVTTSAALADRLVRNEAREVTGILLRPDELVELHVSGADIKVQLPASLS